jgi:hypothetical protein
MIWQGPAWRSSIFLWAMSKLGGAHKALKNQPLAKDSSEKAQF